MEFRFECSFKTEKGRADEMYKTYIDATNKKSRSEQILKGLAEEIE